MAEKDLTEKILEDYNDVFADIINVLLFNGEQRIKPNSLKAASPHSQYRNDESKIREMERDVIKNWTDDDNCNINIAVCGIENQTKIEKLMPLRIFGYEGASYRSQVTKITNKEWKYPVPVVTLVLYFGEEHWNQPKTLKELLDIPDGLDEYVNDQKINVFEISWLTDEQLSMFQSDFGIVAKFFVEKRKNPDYEPNDIREINHVDEVLKLLSVMTHDNRYIDLEKNGEGRRIHNMCDVADRLEGKGVMNEKQATIRRMIREGIKDLDMIARISQTDIETVQKIESEMLQPN